MENFLTIKEAAKYIHVDPSTLRRWEDNGRIKPLRTQGGQRRYTIEMLDEVLGETKTYKRHRSTKLTIGYCRVSSSGQKKDLARQAEVVQTYCEKQGKPFKIIKDIGSGLNYTKPGLKKLIHLICTEQCDTIVVNYKDRLIRFGFDLLNEVCQEHHVKIVIINQTDELDYYSELTEDIISVITVFSAKLYGKRSHHNEKIVKENKEFFSKEPKG